MLSRLLVFVVAVAVFSLAPFSCRAQTPLDFYKMGQFIEWTTFYANVVTMPKKSDMKAKFDVERRELVKLGAPQPVLDSYDHMVNATITLPWGTAWSSWTATQQAQYTSSSVDFNTLRAWLGNGDTQPRFYFWLGADTEYMVKDGPALVSGGQTIDSVQASYKNLLSDYATFPTADPVSFKTAVPAIQAAVTALGPYSGKTLAAADITAIQQAAQPIYDAANGKVAQ